MEKIVYDLMNDQINKEMYSAYLYLDIANFFSGKGLDGFSNWYEIQAKEEMDHAMKFYHYLLDNDQKVVLEAIAKPDKTYSDIRDPLETGLEHEKYVTSLIHNIYAAAMDAKDFRTMQFLNWFVEEQGEEEKNATELLNMIATVGKDSAALYQMDRELKTRVYVAPVQ